MINGNKERGISAGSGPIIGVILGKYMPMSKAIQKTCVILNPPSWSLGIQKL